MNDPPSSVATIFIVPAAAALFVACGLIGGAAFWLDVSVIRHFIPWRAAHSESVGALIAFTHLGGVEVLLPLTLVGIVAAGLRARRLVWPLALTIIGGRLMVELLKVIVGRPRPGLDAHPVPVFSQSFPSAHAANSMLVMLALALWLSPPRWRLVAVTAAIITSLAIGASRPILGVHWPSDVIGGWSFGLAWVLTFWSISQRHGRGSTGN